MFTQQGVPNGTYKAKFPDANIYYHNYCYSIIETDEKEI
jgi:hypothetical protein